MAVSEGVEAFSFASQKFIALLYMLYRTYKGNSVASAGTCSCHILPRKVMTAIIRNT